MTVMTTSIQFPVLIGDVGGTNARFQVIERIGADPVPLDIVQTSQFQTIEDAIAHCLQKIPQIKPVSVVLACAGPITDQGVDLTNVHWKVRPRPFLASQGFTTLTLVNDFEAQALALPFLQDTDLAPIGPIGRSGKKPEGNMVVVGAGTGLGVGAMVWTGTSWAPVAGEGGHVDLGPRNPRESDIWAHLAGIEGRVSAEEILSGRGMLSLYRAICGADRVAPINGFTPADVSRHAIDGSNPQAVVALDLFCTCLGRVAGDFALTFMAWGGVYIAGGIGTKIADFLLQSNFAEAFEDKAPHRTFLQQLPTYLVTHELPALVGLAAFANNPPGFALNLSNRHWQADPRA